MRANVSWRVAIFLFLVSLTSLSYGQESYTDPTLGITIPSELGGLPLVQVTDYEKESPGLGVGLSFRREDRVKADIYFYNAKLSPIPDGTKSKLMIDHFYAVTGEVMEMEKRGVYKNVQVIVPQEVVSVGGVRFLHANLRFSTDAGPMESHVYLTGMKGQFVKIRFTFPVAKEAIGRETQLDFLEQFGKILAGAAK
jgi:hypothetical protein